MVLEARRGPISIDVILTFERVVVPTLDVGIEPPFLVFVKSLFKICFTNTGSVTVFTLISVIVQPTCIGPLPI